MRTEFGTNESEFGTNETEFGTNEFEFCKVFTDKMILSFSEALLM